MKSKDTQKGSVSIEQIGWLALAVIAVAVIGATFYPALQSAIINTVKDSNTKTYSMYSVACPEYTVPAVVISTNGDGSYRVKFGSATYNNARRPASHVTNGTYTVQPVSGGDIYVCVIDNDLDGIPD